MHNNVFTCLFYGHKNTVCLCVGWCERAEGTMICVFSSLLLIWMCSVDVKERHRINFKQLFKRLKRTETCGKRVCARAKYKYEKYGNSVDERQNDTRDTEARARMRIIRSIVEYLLRARGGLPPLPLR